LRLVDLLLLDEVEDEEPEDKVEDDEEELVAEDADSPPAPASPELPPLCDPLADDEEERLLLLDALLLDDLLPDTLPPEPLLPELLPVQLLPSARLPTLLGPPRAPPLLEVLLPLADALLAPDEADAEEAPAEAEEALGFLVRPFLVVAEPDPPAPGPAAPLRPREPFRFTLPAPPAELAPLDRRLLDEVDEDEA
jgi:hypothetical protein